MSDYPTEKELDIIINWKPDKWDFMSFMDFIKSVWWMADWGFKRKGRIFWLSTGGWSGNEDIVYAMENNKNMFWSVCWQSSKRGGHYKFHIPKIKAQTTLKRSSLSNKNEL